MNKERPVIANIINSTTTEVEAFQNKVIRPIIKMQHQLLILFYQSYLKKKKVDFTSLSEERKKETIKATLEKDIAFKNKIIGSVLGHFSTEEYKKYQTKSSEYNRRVKQIIIKRLQDSISEIK